MKLMIFAATLFSLLLSSSFSFSSLLFSFSFCSSAPELSLVLSSSFGMVIDVSSLSPRWSPATGATVPSYVSPVQHHQTVHLSTQQSVSGRLYLIQTKRRVHCSPMQHRC